MLTLLEALDELNSKSESELTLDYLEELAKKVSYRTCTSFND